jgi:hypothetical protein
MTKSANLSHDPLKKIGGSKPCTLSLNKMRTKWPNTGAD